MKPLIISEETDKSCDLVCSWLQKWRHPYVRENSENFLNPEVVVREFDEDTSVLIKTRGRFVELNDIQMDPATFTNYGNLADMMISKDVIFDKKCRECVLFPSSYGGCADLKCNNAEFLQKNKIWTRCPQLRM